LLDASARNAQANAFNIGLGPTGLSFGIRG